MLIFIHYLCSGQRNYNYENVHVYDGTITPPDPYSDTYEDDPALYDEDDYGEYPYTFNNYYYG